MELKDLTPLTFADLKPGLKVIRMGMSLDGSLFVVDPFVLGEITDDAKWVSIQGCNHCNRVSTTDIGCPPPGESFHKEHRIFQHTPEVGAVLYNLANRQDSLAWLTFLGFEDPEGKLRQMKKVAEELYDEWDELERLREIS